MTTDAFPTRLAQILAEEFRSQTGLARASGISRQRINVIVHGVMPTHDEAISIAQVLGRDEADLIDADGRHLPPLTTGAAA